MESIFVDGNKFTFNIKNENENEEEGIIESLVIELEKNNKKYCGGVTYHSDINWNNNEEKYYCICAINLPIVRLYKILKRKIINKEYIFNGTDYMINMVIKIKIDDDYYDDFEIFLRRK